MGDFTAERAPADVEFKSHVVKLLGQADVGIHGIEVERRKFEEKELPDGLPEEIKSVVLSAEYSRVKTLHSAANGKDRVWFELEDESYGTQKLFELAGPWIHTREQGFTLFVDEVFANLHPLLTRQLLVGFHGGKDPKTPAQAILTTHDTSLLDPQILRRDQVWFVEKTRAGSSRIYSLLDYKPRKGEALERGYLTGRYGAIPFLGDFKF